jgi:hypothetical protein
MPFMKQLYVLLLLLAPVLSKAQIITTIAGNGSCCNTGNGGPALSAGINPLRCALDRKGNLFFNDVYTVHKVDAAGILNVVAGTYGTGGYNGDGIPATSALLNIPIDVAVDAAGNIFIADYENYRVRKVDAVTGIITTVAGNGTDSSYRFSNGVPATNACIGPPIAICLDKYNNLYIYCFDLYNFAQVAKVDTLGMITTYVSLPSDMSGIASICFDATGNLYVSHNVSPPYPPPFSFSGILKVDPAGVTSQFAEGIMGYYGDGGPATNAEICPICLCTDKLGNLYLSGPTGVRRIDTAAIICTVAGNPTYGFSGDGGPATAAQLNIMDAGGGGIATDTSGNLYICDNNNNRIRKVTQPECGYYFKEKVESVIERNEFSLYPNPVHNILTITAANIYQVIITNVVGQTVYTRQYNTQQVQINVADLPIGVYFAKVNGTEVRKFVKE